MTLYLVGLGTVWLAREGLVTTLKRRILAGAR